MKMSMDIKYSGNEAVDAMETITITGNITPKRWYKTILRENGKPYRLAIDILADIVYWHRPDVIQDDNGIVVEIQKRFKNNYLQRSYKEYANLYGESKRTIKAALDRLVDIGVIKRFFRNVTLDNDMVLYNVMFITLNVRRLLELTYTEEDLKKYDLLIQKHASYTTEPVNSKKRTTPYKKCQQGVQKNVPSPAKNVRQIQRTLQRILIEIILSFYTQNMSTCILV